jgi:hypothetical protein
VQSPISEQLFRVELDVKIRNVTIGRQFVRADSVRV